MKKTNLILTLLACFSLSLSACKENNQNSSSTNSNSASNSSSSEVKETWTGEVAAALNEVFGYTDVVPFVEAEQYEVLIKYLGGTSLEIQYVDIYCTTSNTNLMTEYAQALENDGWTHNEEASADYTYATKDVSETGYLTVGYAYTDTNEFNLYVYLYEQPNLDEFSAEWPAEVAEALTSVFGENNPLPGIKASSYQVEVTDDDELGKVVNIYCSGDRTSMIDEYSLLLEDTGYVVSGKQSNGYYGAYGMLNLSDTQYVFYNWELSRGDLHIYTFLDSKATTSTSFPTEFLNAALPDSLANLLPTIENASFKYYVYTESGLDFNIVEVSTTTDPFTTYDDALTSAGFVKNTENTETNEYTLTMKDGTVVMVSYLYEAEKQSGTIIVCCIPSLNGTSDTFPSNSFNLWLSSTIGLSMNDPEQFFGYDADSYTFFITDVVEYETVYFTIESVVEEDPTQAYVAKLTQLQFSYSAEYQEYYGVIYYEEASNLGVILWVKISYTEATSTFSLTFSLTVQSLS